MYLQTFATLPSTNQYCELLNLAEVEEFTVIRAVEQTAGIGQRGNCWVAEGGKNLTVSFILKPCFLPAADQFLMTETMSLAVTDTLAELLPRPQADIRIKWPNDIYVGLSKICGMLISNRVQQGVLQASIVGIGLNVNQTSFPDWVPNPVSLAQLLGHELPLEPLLEQLAGHIADRYRSLRLQKSLHGEYLALLLHRGVERDYLWQGTRLRATLHDVDRFGHLQLVTSDGRPLSCGMKEIAFLLPSPPPLQ